MELIHNVKNHVNWVDLHVGDVIYKLDYNLKEERLDLSTVEVIQIDRRDHISSSTVHIFGTFSDGYKLDTYVSARNCGCITKNKSNEGLVSYGTSISSVLNSISCSTKLYTDTITLLEMRCYECLSIIDRLKTKVEEHKYRGFAGFLYRTTLDDRMVTLDLTLTVAFNKLDNHTYQSKLSKDIYYITIWEAEIQSKIEKAERSLNKYLARIDEVEKDNKRKIRLVEKLNNLKKQYGLQ